jgi:hypothetical protein
MAASPVRWRLISFLGLVAQMMRRPSLSAGSARLLMKLVMAVDAARAKRGATYPQAFAAVARLPEYKKRSLRRAAPAG